MPGEKNMSDDKQNPTHNVGYYGGCEECPQRKGCDGSETFVRCPLGALAWLNRQIEHG